MSITRENLFNLIKSCDFLEPNLILKWEENIKKMPKSFYNLIYRTFKEYKEKYDALYVKFGLEDDKNGQFKELIKEKCTKTIKIVSQSQIVALS